MIELAAPAIWVGVDPGGKSKFGVAIEVEGGDIITKRVSCADEAVDLITARPSGVGVDAPLWWSSGPSGEREADRWIRQEYDNIRSGTVQTLNSLRGAALVQGAMFVHRLREKFPGVPVTEAHPKAAAKALGGWESPAILTLGRWENPAILALRNHSAGDDHERDAYMAAIAAREGFSGRWKRDLSLDRSQSEQDPNSYWLAPVHYFWPR